eukprot:5600-Pelagococcus_subviridis.AAC.1
MSNIRSASSSTTCAHRSNANARCSIRSHSRPGVATTMKPTPFVFLAAAAMAFFCSYAGAPPYTHTASIPDGSPYRAHSACICIASSRVGAHTSASQRGGVCER